MTTNKVKILFSLILLGLFSISCDKNEDPLVCPDCDGSEAANVVIQAYPNANNQIAFMLAAQGITVSWGDGKMEQFTPNSDGEIVCTHKYENQDLRKIWIIAKKFTSFSATNAGNWEELTFKDCPELQTIICASLNLKTLNISDSNALIELFCNNNRLTSLDVSQNTTLKELHCFNNQLTTLDTSQNKALSVLNCSTNQLATLDLSNNIALSDLNCRSNQLTSLKLGASTDFAEVNVSFNQLTADNLNALFDILPTVIFARIIIGNNSGTADSNRVIATDKGWWVMEE